MNDVDKRLIHFLFPF